MESEAMSEVEIVIRNGHRLPANPTDSIEDAAELKLGDKICYVIGIDSYRPRAKQEWGTVANISTARVTVKETGRSIDRFLRRSSWKTYSVERYRDMPEAAN